MTELNFLTSHGRALLCIARDPEVRLRDIASAIGVTERSAYSIVSDLADAGYIVARRTVTKNRKMLDIPSSRERKEWVG